MSDAPLPDTVLHCMVLSGRSGPVKVKSSESRVPVSRRHQEWNVFTWG
ncbi:hypothetical protein [Methanosarcina sp. 1.H.T.1A.1]|nr:hypothetical protein [Methanosarcina sp. 1.H.T.1A.1]